MQTLADPEDASDKTLPMPFDGAHHTSSKFESPE
jgi:hypothetical protein